MLNLKKWIIWSVVSLFLAFELYLYVYISNPLKIGRVEPVKCSPLAINRFLSDGTRFLKWWKSLQVSKVLDSGKGDSVFLIQNTVFSVGRKIHEYENIHILIKNFNLQSSIILVPISRDSTHILWSSSLDNSMNPIKRLKNYGLAVELSHKLDSILDQLKHYLENPEKLYGFPIHEIGMVNNMIITSKIMRDSIPDTHTIYREIQKLRQYAKDRGAIQIDSPMLHIEKNPFKKYECMVGLPLNKKIPDSNPIFYKEIPKGGRILIGTLKGGNPVIESGFKTLELYLSDVQRGTPAIPFQVLKTNRIQVPDSSRWITYLYYPVI